MKNNTPIYQAFPTLVASEQSTSHLVDMPEDVQLQLQMYRELGTPEDEIPDDMKKYLKQPTGTVTKREEMLRYILLKGKSSIFAFYQPPQSSLILVANEDGIIIWTTSYSMVEFKEILKEKLGAIIFEK